MGEVVPRCGVGYLIKIIVRESMCQGVMGVQVRTSSQRRVCESSLYPSTCFYEDLLQLKCVTFEELPGSKDRRVRRQAGEEAICVSRRGDQVRRIVGP
jgi:hypothetical protein